MTYDDMENRTAQLRQALAAIRRPEFHAVAETWMYPYLRSAYLSEIANLRHYLARQPEKGA